MNALLLNGFKSPHQTFREEGILFFPRLFEDAELQRLSRACERIYDQFMEESLTVEPLRALEYANVRHLNDPRYHAEEDGAWKTIMETVADPRCVGLVEQIFGAPSLFYSTTLFFNPRSGRREGNWHRDDQFMYSDEDTLRRNIAARRTCPDGGITGVQLQIALVDTEDIEYVPFSAGRYDSPEEFHIRCADGGAHNREEGMPNAMRVHQRPGDAVAFNATGLHRGRYYHDIPRRTFMISYTPRNKPIESYLSSQPWMAEPGHLDGLSSRAQTYFQDFVNVYRSSWPAR